MQTVEPNNGLEKYLLDRAFETKSLISGTFELLPICNMNCQMCYIRLTPEEMKRQGSPLTGQEWLAIAEKAVKKGMVFTLLTGGEPMLHPDFCDIYLGLRNLGTIVSINTNGTLITKEIADMFRTNMPRRVNISLYGSSNEIYGKLCRNPEGFTQVMHGIHLLKDAGVPMRLNYTLTSENAPDMDNIMKIADELDIPIAVPTYMFPPIRKAGMTEDISSDFGRLSPQDAARAQLEAIRRLHGNDPDYFERLLAILDEVKEHEDDYIEQDPPGGYLCSAGTTSFWANWKGDLTGCGMIQHPFRNLREVDFDIAWTQMQQIVQNTYTSKKCFNCRFRKHCKTCAASALAECGDITKSVSYHCTLCKEYERFIKAEADRVINERKNR